MIPKGNTSYKLSDSFNKFLIEISEGFLSESQFNEVYAQFDLNAAKFSFYNSSEANLFRILEAIFDKKSFLLDSLKYLHHIEIICAISSLSNYLTDIVVRNPEYLYILFDQHLLSSNIDESKLQKEINTSVSNFKNLSSKTRMLRNVKRKYLLIIGTADILGFKDLTQTTEDISSLARAVSSTLFNISFSEIQKKYGKTLPSDFALCSLGKLGGNELNYSSDIDLILFYESNFKIESIQKEFHEIMSETIQLFIKEATAITAESYIYRVDFRLRPDGRNSYLCRTLADTTRYYETRGEDWERQMLIKLSFVAGNKNLFQKFKNYIDPFIYPRSLSNSVIETIKRMKQSIESRLIDERNIKLIPGGIRDIEFAVQALQLMNGGTNSKLKTGNTLLALKELADLKLITDNEYALLYDAYTIYRKIEHFVQLMNDKQTHSLPDSEEIKAKLASYLGFTTSNDLTDIINKYRTSVRLIYDSIVFPDKTEIEDNYDKIKFADFKQARSNLKFLSHGLSLIGEKQFDKSTIKLFQSIEGTLVEFLRDSILPDAVLNNFVKIIRSSKLPSVWYNAFEDRLFFKTFLRICELSQRSIDYIVSSQKMADLFLSKEVFQKVVPLKNDNNLESILLFLSVQHAMSKISFPEFSETLSAIVENKIQSELSNFNPESDFFIAGLGSFANRELSFGSDLDLIVVVDDIKKWKDPQSSFQEILAKLKNALKPFEVDFRLRPEGKSSPLVWDLEGYRNYINSRMRIWEFQALSKLRIVDGSQSLFNKLVEILTTKLSTNNTKYLHEEIIKMYRTKLTVSHTNQQKIDFKNSPGAILSIDTMISLILLSDSNLYKKFINSNSISKLDELKLHFNSVDLASLKNDYLELKNAQIAMQNLLNRDKSILPNDRITVLKLSRYLGFKTTEFFNSRVNSILKNNSSLLNKIRETVEDN